MHKLSIKVQFSCWLNDNFPSPFFFCFSFEFPFRFPFPISIWNWVTNWLDSSRVCSTGNDDDDDRCLIFNPTHLHKVTECDWVYVSVCECVWVHFTPFGLGSGMSGAESKWKYRVIISDIAHINAKRGAHINQITDGCKARFPHLPLPSTKGWKVKNLGHN